MATTPNQLQSVIQIDGKDYEVTAKSADKVKNKLTIQNGPDDPNPTEFDGSEPVTLDLQAAGSIENANKIQVDMKDNGIKPFATITISETEPENGSTGDIWFKYN